MTYCYLQLFRQQRQWLIVIYNSLDNKDNDLLLSTQLFRQQRQWLIVIYNSLDIKDNGLLLSTTL